MILRRPTRSFCLSIALAFALFAPRAEADCDAWEVLDAEAALPIAQQDCDIASQARPVGTPGSEGVVVTNAKLLTQFGAEPDLNRALYTRYFAAPVCPLASASAPTDGGFECEEAEVILVLVPGFEGGAASFAVLAQNVIQRAWVDHGRRVEVWAFDRRSNQLEDLAGLELAEDALDAELAVDWLFGAELGLVLDERLERRAVFYDGEGDVPFIANWTPLVHSLDIDAVVELARSRATEGVFLGGHSAGTGFAARYAATDFDLTGEGPADPGYAKLMGLVMIEGGAGSTSDEPPDEATLDSIEARFGGLYGAMRDEEARCIDGETACAVETQVVDCAAFANALCVEPEVAFSTSSFLTPRTLATLEPLGIQMASGDADQGIAIVQREFGAPDNSVLKQVPDLAVLGNTNILPLGTAEGAVGSFMDDDGNIAGLAFFVATSLGAPGPVEEGLVTWIDVDEEIPASAFTDNGPQPTETGTGVWGVEVEPTRFDRLREILFRGGTNFADWYYPSSGLGATSGLSLDTSALSLDPPEGRGRRDIDNRTQAQNIDVPVIGLGGSNGLTAVPASYLGFARSIAPCATRFRGCDGSPRVVDEASPSAAFPTFGGAEGGFEVHISEGYSHVDIVTAEDDETNNVVAPIVEFMVRIVPSPSSPALEAGSLVLLALLLRRERR